MTRAVSSTSTESHAFLPSHAMRAALSLLSGHCESTESRLFSSRRICTEWCKQTVLSVSDVQPPSLQTQTPLPSEPQGRHLSL